MILPIQPLSQRDTRWANQRLGTINSTTIGSHGCVITSMCMIATYYGHPIFPNAVDDILTERGLYYDGNLYVNNAITRIYPDIKFDKTAFCETTPAPIGEIKNYIDQRKPVVVALMNQGIRHYILVVGYDGDKIYANDPWQGDQVAINDRWGDPGSKILQVNYFSGSVPPQLSVNVPPSQSIEQTTINLGSELGFMEIGAIRSEILDLRRDRQNLESDLVNANAKINQLQNIISTQTPNSQPVFVPTPPSTPDLTPIQDKLTAGLSVIADKINQMQGAKTDVPYSGKMFFDSLKSRKLILSVLSAVIALLNSKFNLGLNQEQLLTVIGPLMGYVGVLGVSEMIENSKSTTVTKL